MKIKKFYNCMSTNKLINLNRKYKKPLYDRRKFIEAFKPKKNILNLSIGILTKIFNFVDDSDDYKNLRLTCKQFYNILENYKEFDTFGFLSKVYLIKNHIPYKLELYNVIKLDNIKPLNYLISECYLKNKKKYGVEINYDYNNEVILRKMWMNGKLNGVCQEYLNNKLIKQSNFFQGVENGEKITILFDCNSFIKTLYGIGIKIYVKKYIDNNLVVHAKYRNKHLHGETLVYFNEPYREGEIKHILNFNRGRLNNTCLMHQHDRILKLQFKNGRLHGSQSIFTIENKLKCIMDFEDGKISGRYAIFDNYKKIEEGHLYNGVFQGNINISNSVEFSHFKYPVENNMLNGEYVEKINLSETRLFFKDNHFVGKYSYNDISSCESIEINFYNLNNFEYRKYKHGREMILFTKKYGRYTLTIYNMNTDNNNIFTPLRQRRKRYTISNFYQIYAM